MAKIDVEELEGPALDWAVAEAVGMTPVSYNIKGRITVRKSVVDDRLFSPSTDWGQGGPLIEGYGLHLYKAGPTILPKAEPAYWASGDGEEMYIGLRPLVAACRAIVAAKFGSEVEVPDELACDTKATV